MSGTEWPRPENYFELDELIKLLAIEKTRGAISDVSIEEEEEGVNLFLNINL